MTDAPKKPDSRFTTISVVMSVYKNDRGEWFRMAIDSILRQSLKSDDIIIVRDGLVSDEINEILSDYELNPSVTVIRLENNVGAGEARNIGIRIARNELVAIMDADDISVPNRLELQLSEFKNNPHLSIVGGQMAEFEGSLQNVVSYRNVPLNHTDILMFSKRRSPFNNMCVCFVKSHILAVGGYNNATRAEDYNLWLALLSTGRKASNLSDTLCYVRINDAALSRRTTFEQTFELLKMRYRYFKCRYISFSDFALVSILNIGMLILPAVLIKLVYKKALRA